MRSYWDEDLAILSAENVSFSIETAGLGSRFSAWALDTFYQTLVFICVSLAVVGFDRYIFVLSDVAHVAIYSLVIFALFTIYYFVFEWLWDGQTPGKRYFGLRVMLSNGLPLTVSASLARNALRIVDFLPFFYGFGSIVALCNSLNQRAGDLVAGTIVVRENKTQKQRKPLTISEAVEAFLSAATTVPGQKVDAKPFVEDEEMRFEAAPGVDAEAVALGQRLSREDYELVRDFLARRGGLPPTARQRLGWSLAHRLFTKLETEPRPDFEIFLEEILAVLSRVYA